MATSPKQGVRRQAPCLPKAASAAAAPILQHEAAASWYLAGGAWFVAMASAQEFPSRGCSASVSCTTSACGPVTCKVCHWIGIDFVTFEKGNLRPPPKKSATQDQGKKRAKKNHIRALVRVISQARRVFFSRKKIRTTGSMDIGKSKENFP